LGSCSSLSQLKDNSVYKDSLKIRSATVKIMNTSIEPSYYRPWELKNFQKGSGSGVILSDGTILTNAHVVDNSRHLTISKENDPSPYEAKILYIGHECDLALIKPVDEDFYKGTTSLPLSGLIPKLHSVVATYGFPIGGERISITEGVISRIEISSYSHSYKSAFLQIQTDAAINPGNSGGPVIQNNEVVGLAFQGSTVGDNIGYMIPAPIISHFLEDVTDGSFDGFPDMGIQWQSLENHDFRDFLNLNEDITGVYVNKVIKNRNPSISLFPGDIITSADGTDIANDGSISFEDGRILFSFLIDSKQIGDSLDVKVLRSGELITEKIPMETASYPIPSFFEYEKLPRYLIYGGLVFQPLDLGYLQTWDDWWKTADNRLKFYTFYYDTDDLLGERKELIILNHVLPHKINSHLTHFKDKIVTEVNGTAINSLDDLESALSHPEDDFTIITCEGMSRPLTILHSDNELYNSEILKTYNIEKDRRMDEEWF